MMKKLIVLSLAAFTSVCFAKPAGVITSEWNNATDNLNFAVHILEIDGERIATKNKFRKLTPGKHVLTLSSELQNRVGRSIKKEFVLNVKPCVKHYLSAQYESTTNREDYEVKVREKQLDNCKG